MKQITYGKQEKYEACSYCKHYYRRAYYEWGCRITKQLTRNVLRKAGSCENYKLAPWYKTLFRPGCEDIWNALNSSITSRVDEGDTEGFWIWPRR